MVPAVRSFLGLGLTVHKRDALRVAVTGHRGFIGQHLTSALRRHQARVVVVEGDVRESLHATEPFDVLCHLASLTPARFAEDPAVGFAVNLGGTLQALELCRRQGARIVFSSTSAVYRPTVGAVTEDHPADPPTLYGQSKRLAEGLCQSYAEHLGVPCVVLRLFNVYGSRQSQDFVIPYLLRCAVTGQVATVHTPDSLRDLVHVGDVAEAFWRACHMETGWHVFNIGSGQAQTVHSLIDAIGLVVGQPLEWRQGAGRADRHPAMWSDVRRAKQELGWECATELLDGLREAAQGTGTPAHVSLP